MFCSGKMFSKNRNAKNKLIKISESHGAVVLHLERVVEKNRKIRGNK